ncbi:MAG: hypothetical protein EOP39_08205 [Rubrivivax sp.]|nr:MAG: hypothetical protein EOP39_08205 [Rubrivivax sp.]
MLAATILVGNTLGDVLRRNLSGKTTKANLKLKKFAVHKGKVVLTLKAPAAMIKAGNACASLFDAEGTWTRAGCLPIKGGKTITFEQLPAGTYTVALQGANSAKKVTVKKNKTTKLSMTRAAGTTLSGKITDSKGKAVKDAWVGVRDANDTWLNAYTNSKGVYKVTGVTTGTYRVESDGVYESTDALTAKSVKLTGKKATVNIKLTKGSTLTGKVVNSKGKAVAGVQVSVYSGNTWATTTTNAKGVYKLQGLLAGKYKLSTYDPYDGGYFHGMSSTKSVAKAKTATVGTIKLKG